MDKLVIILLTLIWGMPAHAVPESILWVHEGETGELRCDWEGRKTWRKEGARLWPLFQRSW